MSLQLTPITLGALDLHPPDVGSVPTWNGSSWDFLVSAFNVRSSAYGAVGDNVTDDTAAIRAACTACSAAGGGIVYLPPGTYKVTGSISPATNVSIVGAGASVSILAVTGNIDVISSGSYPSGALLDGVTFRNFGITWAVQATAGSAFNLPWASRIVIDDVKVAGCFNAFSFGQAPAGTTTIDQIWMSHVDVRLCKGSALNFNGQGGGVYITDSNFSGLGNATTSTCLSWNNSYYDVLWLRGLDFENFGVGLNFSPSGSGAGLTDAFIYDTIIDGTQSAALKFSVAAAATIGRVKCRNLWATTTVAGSCAEIAATGASSYVKDVTFEGCNFQASAGAAVKVAGNGTSSAVVSDISIDSCQMYGSTTGVQVTGCARFSLQDSTIGSPYTGGTTGLDITGGSNTTEVLIQNNRVSNYTTPASFTLGTGAVVRDNVGLSRTVEVSTRPEEIALTGFGMKSWTTNPLALGSSVAPATQNVFFTAIALRAGDIISNLLTIVAVAGTSTAPTLIKLGLYNADGSTLLASTANLASDSGFTSIGLKSFPVSSPYTVPTTGIYLVAFLKNGAFAGTDISIGRNTPGSGSLALPNGQWSNGTGGTGKTDLPAALSFSSSASAFWFGAS